MILTIIFIAIFALIVPFIIPNQLHQESELDELKTTHDRFFKLYWKDSLKIFSIATLAYLVFMFSLLRTGGKHANEIILTVVIVIIVWSMAYIYAHAKDK